jgi:hypothetical protein
MGHGVTDTNNAEIASRQGINRERTDVHTYMDAELIEFSALNFREFAG